MSKFPHDTAEELYASDMLEEEYGDSSEGMAWAGLYEGVDDPIARRIVPFVVLVESNDGFVDYYRCESIEQADAIIEQRTGEHPAR